jgi:3-hydroxyacyl-CoA dehydrogenase
VKDKGMKRIAIAGSGVLGTQIAFQTALYGYEVTVYDISEDILTKAKQSFQSLAALHQRDMKTSPEKTAAAILRIELTTDLTALVADADLLIEAIPELIEVKNEFYAKVAPLAPAKTIFATNTSTLLPSQLAAASGRPEKFLALHFANEIWTRNTAEVMGHVGTDAQIFQAVLAFAKSIGMVALPLYKEQPGYITNSLLIPWVTAALRLWGDDVADFQTIDKTWMIGVKSPFVPFAFVDLVGLNTACNISAAMAEAMNDPALRRAARRLKEEYLDKGKFGLSSGEGFYKYPNPEFSEPAFVGDN